MSTTSEEYFVEKILAMRIRDNEVIFFNFGNLEENS